MGTTQAGLTPRKIQSDPACHRSSSPVRWTRVWTEDVTSGKVSRSSQTESHLAGTRYFSNWVCSNLVCRARSSDSSHNDRDLLVAHESTVRESGWYGRVCRIRYRDIRFIDDTTYLQNHQPAEVSIRFLDRAGERQTMTRQTIRGGVDEPANHSKCVSTTRSRQVDCHNGTQQPSINEDIQVSQRPGFDALPAEIPIRE